MAYLIQGNSNDVFTAFGYDFMVCEGSSTDDILKDVERTLFFGSAQDCQYHINTWCNNVKSDHLHYAQGNMTAGNLSLIFGCWPLFEADIDGLNPGIEYFKSRVNINFAFVDTNKQLCGLSLFYLKDNPDKWIIGLVKNTNRIPAERQVYILTSTDPGPFKKINTPASITRVSPKDTSLETQANEPYLQAWFRELVDSDGNMNVCGEVIDQYLQFVRPADVYKNNQKQLDTMNSHIPAIMQNKALKKLRQLSISPSDDKIAECLDTNSAIYREICAISLDYSPLAELEASLLLAKNTPDMKPLIIQNLKILKVNNTIIDLLKGDDEKGKLLFKAVCEVEFACLAIKKRLLNDSFNNFRMSTPFEEEYRQAMYNMLHAQIIAPSDKTAFGETIKAIEEPFLNALDVEANPWLRRSLMVLVNTLTILFTFGILNAYHKVTTGDFFFFSRPATDEALRVLNHQIIDDFAAPAA